MAPLHPVAQLQIPVPTHVPPFEHNGKQAAKHTKQIEIIDWYDSLEKTDGCLLHELVIKLIPR